MTDRIPDDAIDRLDDGRTFLSMRKHALIAAARALACYPTGLEEVAALTARLDVVGQDMQRRLGRLLALLEDYERAENHLLEELETTRERMSSIPPFWAGEPAEFSRARQDVERLRSQLGEELRKNRGTWLERRAELEVELAECWREYRDTLDKVELITQTPCAKPTLAELLRFLDEPPSSSIMVIEPPIVMPVQVRIP